MSAQTSFEMLFRGLDHNHIDFTPVVAMAAEFFTHIGVACEYNPSITFRHLTIIIVAVMNPGGPKSGTSTANSVSESVEEEMEKLLQRTDDFGKRKQDSLKGLVRIRPFLSYTILSHRCIEQAFKRDGEYCLLTRSRFVPFDPAGVDPALAHIIPNSVHTNVCIQLFETMTYFLIAFI